METNYHIVFWSKDRVNCLSEIKASVQLAINTIKNDLGFKILNSFINENHIHILMAQHSDESISKIIKKLKQTLNDMIWADDNSYLHLKRFYLDSCELWSNDFVCSVINDTLKIEKIFEIHE